MYMNTFINLLRRFDYKLITTYPGNIFDAF